MLRRTDTLGLTSNGSLVSKYATYMQPKLS